MKAAEPCRSCGASVIWTTTQRGKAMPVNAEPQPDGNLAVEFVDGKTIARVVPPKLAFGRRDLRKSHFATCRDAAKWRNRGHPGRYTRSRHG